MDIRETTLEYSLFAAREWGEFVVGKMKNPKMSTPAIAFKHWGRMVARHAINYLDNLESRKMK